MIGKFGYVKTKKLTDKEYKRKSMQDLDLKSNNVDIKDTIEISNKKLKKEKLNDFTSRKALVQEIIADIISKGKFTVNINLKDLDVEQEKLERFIIELIPRLKEIGGSIIITNNDNILSSAFLMQNGL